MLAGPLLVRYGIDQGIGEGDTSALNLAGALFVVTAIGAFFFARAAILLVAQIGEKFLRDLRVRVFRHLMGLGLDFFEKEQTGRLVARMTSDVDALQELVQIGLTSIVQNTMLFVGALVVIFVLSWQLALVLLFTVPPIWFATRWFQRESNRAYHEVRERIGHNLANLQEGLAGVRVVQAFARENAFAGRFQDTNEAQYDANMDAIRISIRYFPFVDFCGVAALAAIVGLGGVFVDQGVATVGTVAAFVLYVNNLFEPGAAAQPVLQHSAVVGRRAGEAVRVARHAAVDRRAAGRDRSPGRRRDRGRPRVVRVRRPRRAPRREPHHRCGRAHRARRPHRRRKVDAGQAHRAVLRPARRHGVVG